MAACAQAPALRTSGTEGSLTLSASLLCAGDEDEDEDDDEDDDETSENDAAREDDDYETAFRGSREMRDAYSGHGAGSSRRACAQYAPYIDKFKCWAKRTRRMLKNSTVVTEIDKERDDLLEYREKVKRWKSFNKKLDINNLDDLLEFYDPVTRQFEAPKHRYNGRKPVAGLLCDDIQSTPLIGSKKFKNLCIKCRYVGPSKTVNHP